MSNTKLEQVLESASVPFDRLHHEFEQVFGLQHQTHVRRWRIAGRAIQIRVVGNDWARLVDASMGQSPPWQLDDEAELSIDLWDAAITNHPVLRLEGDTVLKCSEDGRFIGDQREYSVQWLDRETNHIVGFARGADWLMVDERARPCQKLISAWLMEQRVQFIHAGMVAHNGRGALFAGRGGSGKSTSSVACLQAGLDYLGDDFLGLDTQAESVRGLGIYTSALLDPGNLGRFPQLAEHLHLPGPNQPAELRARDEKGILYAADLPGTRFFSDHSIDAVLLPRIIDQPDTSIEPASRGKALLALAPSSVMYLPRPDAKSLDILAELIETVPAFWLNLGREVTQIPVQVRTLLESL